MHSSDLHRAVSRATGEPMSRVQRIGFSLIVVPVRLPACLKRQYLPAVTGSDLPIPRSKRKVLNR